MAESNLASCLLTGVFDTVHLGIVVLDHERRVVMWNGWMARHAGLGESDVLGRDLFALFSELRGKRIEQAVGQALQKNFPSLLSQTLHKAPFPLFAHGISAPHEERLRQAVSVSPLKANGSARHCMIQIADVSVAVGREKLLREQAQDLLSLTFLDALTGIANRRHFDVSMDKEMRRAKRNFLPLSLLMIDIDYFKAYNDHFGHQNGDRCLTRVAGALAAMLNRPSDLIARYGGEEFAVILPDVNARQSVVLAETMRRRVAELAIEHPVSQVSGFVTVSIGVSTAPGADDLDTTTLLGHADRALYAAKHEGRNRVVAHNPG